MKETNRMTLMYSIIIEYVLSQDQLTIENANKVGETRNVAAMQCRSSCLTEDKSFRTEVSMFCSVIFDFRSKPSCLTGRIMLPKSSCLTRDKTFRRNLNWCSRSLNVQCDIWFQIQRWSAATRKEGCWFNLKSKYGQIPLSCPLPLLHLLLPLQGSFSSFYFRV